MRGAVIHSELIGAAVVANYLLCGAMLTAGEQGSRAADGKPNLNGIWQALNTANWDIQGHAARPGPPQFGALFAIPASVGVVEGNEIPYLPAAAAKRKENFDKRWTADPEAKCYLPGVPRATYLPYPFQIIQSTGKIMMVYEFASAVRVIHLDKVPDAPVDTWMGHSVGRWDGNTLVVNVNAFNGQAWFDRSGNFASDTLRVTERYTQRGTDAIQYDVTLEDPNTFSRPWKMSMPLYRRLEKDARILEFKCVEFSEELLYGHLRKKPSR